MSKNKKEDSPVELLKPQWRISWPMIILALFTLLASLTMYYHEMWRDEYQAWLIASSSNSISELFSNIRYEGHPSGWFLILFFISGMTSDPVWMQIFHLSVAVLSVFLILRYSPFTFLEKTFLVFGYFFLYEYCIIARNYSIAVLLILLICITFQKGKINGWILGILLFGLSQTNLYGGIISGIFLMYLLLKVIEFRKNKKYVLNSIFPIIFGLLGLILLYTHLEPATHVLSNDYYKWSGGWSLERIFSTGATLFNVYFPLPSTEIRNSFGKSMFSEFPVLKTILVLIPFVLTIKSIQKNKSLLAMLLAGTIVILTILYFNQHTSLRHEGFLFILYVATLWLFISSENSQTKFVSTGRKVFLIVLIVQCIGGLLAVRKEVFNRFSNIKEAGNFVVSNRYDTLSVSGIADYIVSPISAFTKKPIYMAESGREEKFIVWDNSRKENNSNIYALLNRADSLIKGGQGKTVIIMSQALRNDKSEMVPNAPISDHSEFTLVKQLDRSSIVGDENYYFYEVSKRINK